MALFSFQQLLFFQGSLIYLHLFPLEVKTFLKPLSDCANIMSPLLVFLFHFVPKYKTWNWDNLDRQQMTQSSTTILFLTLSYGVRTVTVGFTIANTILKKETLVLKKFHRKKKWRIKNDFILFYCALMWFLMTVRI